MTTTIDFMQIAEGMTGDKMLALCHDIVAHGLAISGGQVVMADNEVMQNTAQLLAMFPADQLDERLSKPTGKPILDGSALLIVMCSTYYRLSVAQKSDYGQVYIDRIAQVASDMRRAGWRINEKPVNHDVDARNTKLAGYVEPVGVAAEFVCTFDIEYKKAKMVTLALVTA